MDKHGKKMIAPIVITVITIIYYLGYFGVLIWGGLLAALNGGIPILLVAFLGIIPILLSGVMLYVCIQRIKEIRSGEEDDLSKY